MGSDQTREQARCRSYRRSFVLYWEWIVRGVARSNKVGWRVDTMGWVWGGFSYPLFPEKEEFFHFGVARFGAFRASWCGDCVDVTAT